MNKAIWLWGNKSKNRYTLIDTSTGFVYTLSLSQENDLGSAIVTMTIYSLHYIYQGLETVFINDQAVAVWAQLREQISDAIPGNTQDHPLSRAGLRGWLAGRLQEAVDALAEADRAASAAAEAAPDAEQAAVLLAQGICPVCFHPAHEGHTCRHVTFPDGHGPEAGIVCNCFRPEPERRCPRCDHPWHGMDVCEYPTGESDFFCSCSLSAPHEALPEIERCPACGHDAHDHVVCGYEMEPGVACHCTGEPDLSEPIPYRGPPRFA